MALIYHKFPDREQADLFARSVRAGYDIGSQVYDDPDKAADAAVFPFELTAPVVLVDRPDNWHTDPDYPAREAQLEQLAQSLGGVFAGT